MTAELKRTAPVGETGELRRKTGVEVVNQTPREVVSEAVIDTDYAKIVVQGSRPHIIRPSTKKALSFYWPKKGAVVFFAKVQHPGTDPNPFFDRVVGGWADYLRRAQ